MSPKNQHRKIFMAENEKTKKYRVGISDANSNQKNTTVSVAFGLFYNVSRIKWNPGQEQIHVRLLPFDIMNMK